MSKCIFLTTLRRYLVVVSVFVLVVASLGILPTVHGQEATPIIDPGSPDTGSDGPVPEIPDGDDVEAKPEQWVNHDAIYVSNELYAYSLGPGPQATTEILYFVTTPRDSTTLSFALMRDGQAATGWAIAISGTSGTSGDGSASTTYTDQTSLVPDTSFAISIAVTAPVSLAADETVTLHATSTAETAEGSETGVIDAGPLMSYTVLAPTPTPSPTAESVIASPTPTSTLEPSPTPEPTATSVPVIDDRFEMTPGQPAAVSLLAGTTSEFDVNYVVTSARTSTTFTAVVIDLVTSDLATGWIVSLNGQANVLVDTSGVSAGTTFPLHVTVTAPIEAESGQNLVVQVSSAVQSAPDAQFAPSPAFLSMPVEVAGDGEFSAQSVTNPSFCTSPQGVFDQENVFEDAVAPGQVIAFVCQFVPTGLGSGTVTFSVSQPKSAISGGVAAPDWETEIAYTNIAAATLPVLGSVKSFSNSEKFAQTTALLSTGQSVWYEVRIRAPLQPSLTQTSDFVYVNISATCSLTLFSCGSNSAAIGLQLNLTGISTSGGELKASVLGFDAGEVLAELVCTEPTSYLVQPRETRTVECSVTRLASLDLLGTVALSGTISVISTDNDLWNPRLKAEGQATGLSIPIGDLVKVDTIPRFDFQLEFDGPNSCATDVTSLINSFRITAVFGLKVGSTTLQINDGIALVPAQLDGTDSDVLPDFSIETDDLDFGTFFWDGSVYRHELAGSPYSTVQLNVGVGMPTTGCIDPTWSLRIFSNSDLENRDDTNMAISASAMTVDVATYDNGVIGTTTIPKLDASTLPAVLVTGTDLTPDFTATLDITIDPPEDASVGTYEGMLVIDISSDWP